MNNEAFIESFNGINEVATLGGSFRYLIWFQDTGLQAFQGIVLLYELGMFPFKYLKFVS